MSASTSSTPISEMNFETALRELEKIVTGLESGNIPLELSIASYERGSELKKHCEQKLAEAKLRVDKISLAADGSAKLDKTDMDI